MAVMALLFSFSSAVSKAQTAPSIQDSLTLGREKLNVRQTESMKFRLTYHSPESATINLRIYDHNSNLLYTENRRVENHLIKYFDLSHLADGTYTFEVREGADLHKQSFDILTETSRVASAE